MTTPVTIVKKRKPTVRTFASTPAPEVKAKPQPTPAKPQPTAEEKAAKLAAHHERMKAEQHAAKLKRREDNNRLLAAMGELWPAIFAPDAPTVPLKIGVDKDLIAALCPYESPTKVKRVLGLYLHGLIKKRYLKALSAGGPRYDLDGQECGLVTEEEQERARVELAEMKGKKGE